MGYWASNKPGEPKMYGVSEEIAKILMKERLQRIECKGDNREWCRNEYRTGPRYG